MGKYLIIAEKPSLAKNIVSAIPGTFKKCDGYFEGDKYIVSWAFGHLFSLIDVAEYRADYKAGEKYPWTLDNLPFYPRDYSFKFALKRDPKTKKTDPGVAKQFKILKTLCASKDVDAVINAGDADREGEIIIRLILDNARNKKPVYRLWLPDQTASTIQRELKAMKSDDEFDNLADEGISRTYIDWLYGVNLTRLATLKSGSLLRVGRVIVPIVRAIYDRDLAIRNFVPEKYFALVSKEETNGSVIELVSKKTFPLDEREVGERLANDYNGVPAFVSDSKSEEKIIFPPKLFSLSKLQGVLGRKYKMSLKDSLAIVQKLYEAGYVTYPRTNSEYLATAEKDKIAKILSILKTDGYPVEQKNKKSVYDDSKIESHSALTPTHNIPDMTKLSADEQKVYSTIFNRFVAVFCSVPCKVNRTTICIKVGEYEEFKIKGDVYISKGWQEYDGPDKADVILPKLKMGDKVNTFFALEEKETKPPKHYTVDSLNNFLKNPFKKEKANADEALLSDSEEDDTEDYKALFEGVELGTEATRTGIIENAIVSKYISFSKNTYFIQPGGEYLIETLDKLGIDMNKEKTAELGRVLKKVYRSELSVDEAVDIAKDEIDEFFVAAKGTSVEKNVPSSPSSNFGSGYGVCPLCQRNLFKNKSGNVSCSGWKDGCNFVLWTTVAGKKLTDTQIKTLLTKRKTGLIKGFTSKSGKPFNAHLIMGDDGKVKFEF